MKNLSKHTIIFSLWLSLCIMLPSCNQREIKNIHIYSQPQLGLKYEEKDVYYKEYPVYLTLNLDKDNGIDSTYTVRHEIKTGKGKLLDENDTLPKEILTQSESLKLQYIPQALGNHIIVFTLVDSQGQESTVDMQVKGVKEKTIDYPDFTVKVIDTISEPNQTGIKPLMPNTFYITRGIKAAGNSAVSEVIKYRVYLEEDFIADEAVKYELKVENALSEEDIKGRINIEYKGINYDGYLFPGVIPLDIKEIRAAKGFFDLKLRHRHYYLDECDTDYLLKPFNTSKAYNFKITNGKAEQRITQPFNVHILYGPYQWFRFDSYGYAIGDYKEFMPIKFRMSKGPCIRYYDHQKFEVKFEPLNYTDHELTSATNDKCHDLRIKANETRTIRVWNYRQENSCIYFAWSAFAGNYWDNFLWLKTKGCNRPNNQDCDLPKARVIFTHQGSGAVQSFLVGEPN